MENNTFNLRNTNIDFTQRHKNVFDQLKVLENNRKNSGSNDIMKADKEIQGNKQSQRSITKHFKGKESIFKRPQNPAPKNFINRIPDFKKNPHKWTKYSLADVKEEDMSDETNTRTALSFLKELRERKSQVMDSDQNKLEELPTKIVFNDHASTIIIPGEDENSIDSKPSFRGSKVIMPEYVVGKKIKKERKVHAKAVKTKELKLDHLFENEDE